MNHKTHYSDSALPIALATLGLVAACGGSNQAPANEPSQQSAQNSGYSGYQTTTPPGETAPMGGTAWGATNQQSSDTSTSSMPSSDQSTVHPSSNPASSQDMSSSLSPRYGSPGSSGALNDTSNSGSAGSAALPSESEIAKLDDAQFAAVIQSLNDGEVRLGQLAEGQTTNPDVKRFAHDMVVSHQGMLNKDKALWTKIHITPAPNAISGQLDAETQNDVTNLTNTHGDSFDRGYADSQVRDHKNAVDLVDKITPNVKSAAFKADLAAARPKLEAHLRMAESVQKQIEKGVTNQQPGDKGKR